MTQSIAKLVCCTI